MSGEMARWGCNPLASLARHSRKTRGCVQKGPDVAVSNQMTHDIPQ
jgi:hypothetical protein